jgi:hypothetical protein
VAHTLLDRPACTEVTEATRVAARNFDANRRALGRSQSWLVDALPPADDLTWIFGRDGSLTGIAPGETWHTGCSVPLLAARAILKTLDPGSGSVCFLNPQHAAHVRVALEHLQLNQALICVLGDRTNAATLLHCDDFSSEIERGRMSLACDDDWARQLIRILDERPGLPVPSRFIRLPKVDQQVLERTIAEAQRVFTDCTARRTAAITTAGEGWKRRSPGPDKPRVCVVARSMFRLWDDAGETLYRTVRESAAAEAHWSRFDPDDPAGCSPLALATAIGASDAVVAADVGRADLPPGLAPAELPCITWVTSGRIPAFSTAGRNDRLLLADARWAADARNVGWPTDRLTLAGWPTIGASSPPSPSHPHLAIIADTCPIEPPETVTEYSSHTLLWEKMQQVIGRDPLSVPDDPAEWVRELATNAGIDLRSLDVPLFVHRLVLPAYAQAIADILISTGIPLRIHGSGWDLLPRFRSHAAGPVASRDELSSIAQGAAALVHVWPSASMAAHPIDALGRPVLRANARRRDSFVRDAGQLLDARPISTFIPPSPALSAAILLAARVGMAAAR